MLTNKQLLFKARMNQQMLAEKLDIKGPYVSKFLTGHGRVPRKDWQKLYEYFLELRVTQ